MTEHRPPRRPGSDRPKPGGLFQDGRERIDRARAAAEALFRPKRQVTQPAASGTQSPAEPAVRKPRTLASLSPVTAGHAADAAPPAPEPPRPPKIPASQFARIRVWVKYGMTIPQVAQIYGVAVGEIERILKA